MSPANWEALHYVQRPAKNIERKLIIEVLSRLARYRRLSDFHYVGLGSLYFVDFVLVHRLLGISGMTSIEDTDDDLKRARFRFNKPYRFIGLRFGHTNDELPLLPWRWPSIVWLDYTARMGEAVFTDIATVITRAPRPCVLLVTVNAQPSKPPENRVQQFRTEVGDERVPEGFDDANSLAAWGTAAAAHRVFIDEIDRRLTVNNAGLEPGLRTLFRQLVRFHYADGAKMLTTGGLLYAAGDEAAVGDCRINDSPYAVPEDAAPYEIVVPNLTTREMQHLSQKMAKTGTPQFERIGVSADLARAYRDAAPYFPLYVDIDLV